LNIFGHDGNPLGVDRTQIGIFKQTNQIGLSSFLKGKNSVTLEPQISLQHTNKIFNTTNIEAKGDR